MNKTELQKIKEDLIKEVGPLDEVYTTHFDDLDGDPLPVGYAIWDFISYELEKVYEAGVGKQKSHKLRKSVSQGSLTVYNSGQRNPKERRLAKARKYYWDNREKCLEARKRYRERIKSELVAIKRNTVTKGKKK